MRQSLETVFLRRNATLREGLARAQIVNGSRVVSSDSCVRGLEQIPLSQDQPLLLIVDAGNEQNDVLSQIRLFRKLNPLGRVVVLADHFRRSDAISAYQAGANACFIKTRSCSSFIKTLELVMLGETILPPELLPFISHHDDRPEHTAFNEDDALPLPGIENNDARTPTSICTVTQRSPQTGAVPLLSVREKCILRCVFEGCSNKRIARKIDIAEATVKAHVKAIFRKLHVSNRTQAAIWAMNNASLVWPTRADAPRPKQAQQARWGNRPGPR
jgi:two-component system, NarL family, nitrate/nitrite response regulator NarL